MYIICQDARILSVYRGLRSCPTMLNRGRAARACGYGCMLILIRASEKSKARVWCVDAFAPSGDGIVWVCLCPQVRCAHLRLGMVGPLRGRGMRTVSCSPEKGLAVCSIFLEYVLQAIPDARKDLAIYRCMSVWQKSGLNRGTSGHIFSRFYNFRKIK